jgi:2-hydroxychromene-2-carboxylate isomerase
MSPDDIALALSMLHVLVGVASVIALIVLIAAARWLCRRQDLTDKETRARVYNRAGLTNSGEHRLPPDDDPIWQAGQRALRKAQRRKP